MRVRVSSLLCELHAHTTWSDGELSLSELVDLYGSASAGFDVLCVTDHVLRADDPWPALHGHTCVDEDTVPAYLNAIAQERSRALSRYGLLLLPGLDLTYNDRDPTAPATRSPSASSASSRWTTARPPRWSAPATKAPRWSSRIRTY